MYLNEHKTGGHNRSKLEYYLETRIAESFSDLPFQTNCRSIIGYELDFYFPTLSLAIEINGPTHYTPIYSQSKFERVQEIDALKKSLCDSVGIELVVVNNTIRQFTPKFGEECFEIVSGIVSRIRTCDLRVPNPAP